MIGCFMMPSWLLTCLPRKAGLASSSKQISTVAFIAKTVPIEKGRGIEYLFFSPSQIKSGSLLSYPPDKNHSWNELAEFIERRNHLSYAQGTHYADMDLLSKDTWTLAQTIEKLRTSLPHRLYWKETSPQHYLTEDGKQLIEDLQTYAIDN